MDLNKAYEEYDQNKGGLIVIAAFNSGSDSKCEQWDNGELSTSAVEKVKYPSISGDAGGLTINNDYGPSAYPTVILIDPARKIVENDIYPTSDIESTLKKYDIGVTEIAVNGENVSASSFAVKFLSSRQVSFISPVDGLCNLTAFSADGKKIGTLFHGYLSKGKQLISCDLAGIANGIYFPQLRLGNIRATEKIILP